MFTLLAAFVVPVAVYADGQRLTAHTHAARRRRIVGGHRYSVLTAASPRISNFRAIYACHYRYASARAHAS